jgi:RNA polymerase sigma factor (sigma-70 family)
MKRSSKLPVLRHYRALFESGSFCGLSDGELLARFFTRDGDSAELAFAVLVERHASAVMRICKAIVGNASDAEDAFQATFLVLATKAGRLTVRETLAPWLASVARRISRRARGAALARAARELRAAGLAEMRETSVDDREDDAAVLHEEIERLPERYRLPLLLCDLECQSHQDAARALGWPLGTVKSRQARGRQRLRARLSRRGFSGSLPIGWGVKSIRSFVTDSLIQATARAAVGSVSCGTAAGAVSAAVSNLVTNTLRAMIMTRLTILVGVLLTLCGGVAATVVAQTYADPTKRSGTLPLTHLAELAIATPDAAPVFEYEIRIWKDGVPVTPTMKMRAHPGETSQLKIPEGTVNLSFQPRSEPAKPTGASANPGSPAGGTQVADQAAAIELLTKAREQAARTNAQELLQNIARVRWSRDAEKRKNRDPGPTKEASSDIALKAAGAESKDQEKRLAEIERKLERILSVLDRVPQKDPIRNSSARP